MCFERTQHLAICSKLALSNPPKECNAIEFWKLRNVALNNLKDNIRASAEMHTRVGPVEELVQTYNPTPRNILNAAAPEQSRLTMVH